VTPASTLAMQPLSIWYPSRPELLCWEEGVCEQGGPGSTKSWEAAASVTLLRTVLDVSEPHVPRQ
jgi:hypothetical protein